MRRFVDGFLGFCFHRSRRCLVRRSTLSRRPTCFAFCPTRTLSAITPTTWPPRQSCSAPPRRPPRRRRSQRWRRRRRRRRRRDKSSRQTIFAFGRRRNVGASVVIVVSRRLVIGCSLALRSAAQFKRLPACRRRSAFGATETTSCLCCAHSRIGQLASVERHRFRCAPTFVVCGSNALAGVADGLTQREFRERCVEVHRAGAGTLTSRALLAVLTQDIPTSTRNDSATSSCFALLAARTMPTVTPALVVRWAGALTLVRSDQSTRTGSDRTRAHDAAATYRRAHGRVALHVRRRARLATCGFMFAKRARARAQLCVSQRSQF